MINFVPKNEAETVYMFSRYHERLGFEKIINIQTAFPDITALRDGKKVRIEMEFVLSRFKVHYKAFDKGYNGNEFRWNNEKNQWWAFDRNYNKWSCYSAGLGSYDLDRLKNKDLFYVRNNGHLYYKSLKDECDYVICWRVDTTLDDDIKIIELQSVLKNDGG